MITFQNVTKRYKNDHYALKNVSLEIHSGEFVFIVGASGAGKSTLMKLLYSEEKPTSGIISIGGLNIANIANKNIPNLRRCMGIVFQDFRLIDKMTVFENVAFAMRVTGTKQSVIKKRVPHVLKLVGLEGMDTRHPSELSGGEQQRVSLARALANEPSLIIADEPTGNVDPKRSYEIMNLLQEVNKMGTTVIVVTHEHNLVTKFNGRVIKLKRGKIVKDTAEEYYKERDKKERESADRFAGFDDNSENKTENKSSDNYDEIQERVNSLIKDIENEN